MENENGPLGRLLLGLVMVSIALIVSGTNACRENYNFAAQTTLAPTASASESETTTATETPEETETPTATSTSTATASATPTATRARNNVKAKLAGGLLESLEGLSDPQPAAPAAGGVSAGAQGDWLGHIYDEQEVPGVSIDSDGDGFTNELERDAGSDPSDARSVPAQPPVTSLAARLLNLDDDADGVMNDEELRLGTDPSNPDSDGDGVNDGAEILAATDPIDPGSKPADSDGDGLSNDYESEHELNWRDPDTDGDGLRDDVELALGCNPRDNDSDRDGILDGKEVRLGSDPVLAEPREARDGDR